MAGKRKKKAESPTVCDAFREIGLLLECYTPAEQGRILDALYVVFGLDRPPVGKVPDAPSKEIERVIRDMPPARPMPPHPPFSPSFGPGTITG